MKNIISINKDNLKYNFLCIKNNVCKNKERIFPVLKANAYGMNANYIANALLELNEFNEKSFVVFSIQEAISLKEHFKDKIKDIFVLDGVIYNNEAEYCKYSLTPIFNNFEELKTFQNYLNKNNIVKGVCLQFNSGMNRNGFDMDKIPSIKKFISNNNVELKAIITHFACADDKNHIVSKQQLSNCKVLKKEFPNVETSFYATNASINFENEVNTNIIRVGAGLYGIGTKRYLNGQLKQVFSLKSLVEMKDNQLMIGIGLNDGLFEEYGKKGYVLIDGEKIYIKSIFDDYCILNIKNDFDKYLNKYALLTGYNDKDFIHIDDFGSMNDTIGYEMQVRIMHNVNLKNKKFILFDEKNNELKFDYNNDFNYYTLNTYKKQLYSRITEIRHIKDKNSYVGYDAIYRAHENEILLTIIGGYADSFYRNYKGQILYLKCDSKYLTCKIVGKISMDQIIVSIDNNVLQNVYINQKVMVYDENKYYKKLNKKYMNFLIKNNLRIKMI